MVTKTTEDSPNLIMQATQHVMKEEQKEHH